MLQKIEKTVVAALASRIVVAMAAALGGFLAAQYPELFGALCGK